MDTSSHFQDYTGRAYVVMFVLVGDLQDGKQRDNEHEGQEGGTQVWQHGEVEVWGGGWMVEEVWWRSERLHGGAEEKGGGEGKYIRRVEERRVGEGCVGWRRR